MRKILKKVDPHRETRMGYMWSMDICSLSERSEEGSLYLIVLRDNASGTYKLIPCARRTTECLAESFSDWVKEMRSDPVYKHHVYPVISVIKTDNEAAWSLGCAEWQDMIKDLGIRMIYVEPGARHAEENGFAEKAVQNVELAMKSIMVAHALRE